MQYRAAYPERKPRCPLCNTEIEDLGGPIAMNDIKRDLEAIRERCDRLTDGLRWNGPGSLNGESLSHGQDGALQLQVQEEQIKHQVSPEAFSREIGGSHENPCHPLLIDITVVASDEIQGRDNTPTIPSPLSSTLLTTSPNYGLPERLKEASDSCPLPTSLKPKPLGPVQLTEKARKLEDAAISTTAGGLTVVLIESSSFQVLFVPQNCAFKSLEDFPPVCQGKPDPSLAQNQGALSTYHRAALSDNVLCIAYWEGPYIDVHDARSALRLHTIKLPQKCDNLLLSPNGEVLAVAMDSGEVICYPIGQERRFDTMPITLPKFDTGKKVACMTFSLNSENISVCSIDAVIRTYSLIIESGFATEVSRHACKLSPPLFDVSL